MDDKEKEGTDKENLDLYDDMEEEIDEHHFTNKFFRDMIDKKIEIIFNDGEKLRGTVQWFDRWNIKLLLSDEEECIIYRHSVKSYSAM